MNFLQLPVWYMTDERQPNPEPLIKSSKSSYYLHAGLQIGRNFAVSDKLSVEPYLTISFIIAEFLKPAAYSQNFRSQYIK